MKESMKHNELGKASSNYRNIGNNNGRKEFDPRVENIDKINAKIKQILSCLENEKAPSKYIADSQAFKTGSFVCKQTVSPMFNKEGGYGASRQNTTTVFQDKSYPSTAGRQSSFGIKASESKKTYEAHQHKNSDVLEKINVSHYEKSSKENCKPTLDWWKGKDYSAVKHERVTTEEGCRQRSYSYLNHRNQVKSFIRDEKSVMKVSQTRSHLQSMKKSGATTKDDLLKSGKKLNEQISKIQQKIEEFEREKRRLNIQFTPFAMQAKSTAHLGLGKSFDQSCPLEREDSYKPAQNNEKLNSFNKGENNTQKSAIYTKNSKQDPKIEDIDLSKIKLQGYQKSRQEDDRSRNSFNEEALRKRTDEGIQQRKKRLQAPQDTIKTDCIKKLVSLICQQAKADEQLRNLKIWLESCTDPNKYNRIAEQFKRIGKDIDKNNIQRLFKIDQAEHNPFFSVQNFQGSYQKLVKCYIHATEHWQDQILGKFSKQALTSEGFTEQRIDLQRKNYIQLQDLVRFVNIESGTFYRNRDIYMIFRRLSHDQKVKFGTILQQFCQ